METKIVELTSSTTRRSDIRSLSKREFIETHASGSLRKAERLGFATHNMYLEERCCYEFGWEFQVAPASRVTLGKIIAEGDCSAVTETCWHIERLITLNEFDEDVYKSAYITYTDEEDNVIEGMGVYLSETSAKWVGVSKVVFAIIAVWDKSKGGWLEVNNPC